MKIFLSWSGEQSKAFAAYMNEWLPKLIQAVEPFISQEIGKGTRGREVIHKILSETRFGIICLTRANLESTWIHYEAGALAKTQDATLCTFLLDVTPADVPPPLGDWQHTKADEKEDVFRLLTAINKAVADAREKAVRDEYLREGFETVWPKLEARITEIKAMVPAPAEPFRTTDEVLAEILEGVRWLQRGDDENIQTRWLEDTRTPWLDEEDFLSDSKPRLFSEDELRKMIREGVLNAMQNPGACPNCGNAEWNGGICDVCGTRSNPLNES